MSALIPHEIMSPDTGREIDEVAREAELVRQRDRQPIQEDRSLNDNMSVDGFFDGLLEALRRRLK